MQIGYCGLFFLPAVLTLLGLPGSVGAATNQFSVVNSGLSAFVFNGDANPDLMLVRGFSYTFQVNAPGHPFWIKTVQGTGTGNAYNDGVTGNGTQSGAVVFSVPGDAPDLLFYNCQFHAPMTGELRITDPPDVRIEAVTLDTTVTLHSLGTEALNVQVETSGNLTSTNWTAVPVLGNSFASGTNTTEVAAPTGALAAFRVRQGFP